MNGDTAALYFYMVFTYKEMCKYHEINLSKTRLHALLFSLSEWNENASCFYFVPLLCYFKNLKSH